MNLNQSRLNIETRRRTSRLPWRGQFSPEFVEYIIDAVCPDSRSFADPFCGSGTVLFEAAEKNFTSWGVEVNPAAWHLASLAELSSLSTAEKKHLRKFVLSALAGLHEQPNGFNFDSIAPEEYLQKALTTSSGAEAAVFAASVLLGMGNSDSFDVAALRKGMIAVSEVINRVVQFDAESTCFLGDARRTDLPSDTVEAVITSPPYINVFNYHQNYRPAVELLGWKPLQAAKVEIGANRKFRQNRFLTAVQYCIDMQQALSEMSRFMKTGAPLILVVGRTSNVLGCSFKNGAIVKRLLETNEGFGRIRQTERAFTSRFGERIFEDIIIAERQRHNEPDLDAAKSIGSEALIEALDSVSDTNRSSLAAAIDMVNSVLPSAPFCIDIPSRFSSKSGTAHYGNTSKLSSRR